MERREGYPNLDLKQSGNLLRYQIRKSLVIVCGTFRTIWCYPARSRFYRWFQGKTLPSVDHLYALSRLLGVHMEELLAGPQESPVYREAFGEKRYLFSYLVKPGVVNGLQFRLDYLSNDEFERLFYPLVITEMEMTGGFLWIKDE